jgi:hypothetical protein
MKKTDAFVLLLLSSVMLSGCCALNFGIDGHQEFERKANAAVGQKLDLSSVIPGAVHSQEVDSKTRVYEIGQPGYCQIDYVVSTETDRVLSWRYISEPGRCSSNRYYCGAW